MSLGEKIYELRKKKGLSQEQLGEEVNVTRQTMSNWELGETSPNPEQLKKLSTVLNVSIDELLDNDLENQILSKVKVTEEQTEKIKKISKGILVAFIIFLIVDIITFIVCYVGKLGPFNEQKSESNISYIIDDYNNENSL